MDISNLKFSNETSWDGQKEPLMFFAEVAGKKVTCRVSQIALNDHYQTEDTKEKAIENYEKNKKDIQKLAGELIEQDRFDEKGEIFIQSKHIK